MKHIYRIFYKEGETFETQIFKTAELSQSLLGEVKEAVKAFSENQKPKLAIVSVGTYAPSKIYMSKKQKACASCGIASEIFSFQETVSFDALAHQIKKLNEDDRITGIIIQTPLPKHLVAQECFNLVDPKKDVDGLGSVNTGLMTIGEEGLVPATPLGIMRIFKHLNIVFSGKEVVVVGRSHLVGRPTAELIAQQGATVVSCHKETKDVSAHTKNADVVVVATGVAHLLSGEDFKKGAVVIDVGISRRIDPQTGGAKIVGDVDTKSCKGKVALITPVPGGVGPMTVASLITNVVDAYALQKGQKKLKWLSS